MTEQQEWLNQMKRRMDQELDRLYEERRQIEEVEAPRAQRHLIATLEANLAQAQAKGDHAWARAIVQDLKHARRLHLTVIPPR